MGTEVIIPYLASLTVYRRLASGLGPGGGPLNRARLSGELTLTVPVCGGSKALKRLPPENLDISQHGRWQHVHLGALEARLGRTPFWRHLEPSVAPLIDGAAGSLIILNQSLHEVLSEFLALRDLLPELREMARLNPGRLRSVADRFLRDADAETSFLVEAARRGRDAIFTLAPAFIEG